MVNLELYRVFYTVAKCGSLTRAAEELYISQPAVSQSIKQLESQLGVPLFDRRHRGMELSAQGGKIIFAEVERALELLCEAENRLAQLQSSAVGTIRIGASDTIFEYFLADKIVEFHERFPSVKIELMADFTPDTIEKLKANRCDVAFVNLPITIDEELMEAANMIEGEKVQILDINNGERFETYIIKGERGSGAICLNGAAARKVAVDDLVIIVSYAMMDFEEAKSFKPWVIFPDSATNHLVK